MKNFLRVTMLAICAIFMVANVSAQDNYDATTMGNIVRYYETAKWSQGSPFNNQCWTDATQQAHAKTGCVPTAFAIIMRHHGFPVEGIGNLPNQQTGEVFTDRTYDYSKMPLTNGSNWETEQQNEVAKLMAHLGHAFGVTFGQGATSVSIGNTMSERMRDFFNYKYTAVSNQYNNGTMYDFEEWKKNLKNSLDNGCPVPYAADNKKDGTNDTRHMFVIDGYTENEYFHFNFGWGGGSNGWYKLDDITPTGDDYSWRTTSDGYDSKHQAFFNLMPNRTMRTVTASVSPVGAGTVTVNGSANSAEVMEGITATLVATANSGYTFSHWSKGGVQVSTEKTYKAPVAAEGNDYVANFLTVGNTTVNVSVSYNSSYGTVTYNSNAVQGTGITPYQNSEVTLTATPLSGYVFNGWTVKKGTNTTNYAGTELTFVATEDMSVEANFSTAIATYNISEATGTLENSTSSRYTTWSSSEVSGLYLTASYNSNAVEAISFNSGQVKLISAIYEDKTSTFKNPITYTLSAPDGYVITAYSMTYKSSGSNYAMTVANAQMTQTLADKNEVLTLSATGLSTQNTEFTVNGANTNYAIQVQEFTVTLQSEGGGSTQTPTTYTINATAGAGGSVTINGEAVSQKNVNENSTVTVVATPQTGYSFVNWTSGTSTVVSTNATYSFTATGNTSLLANFAQATYTVNVEATEGGSAYIGTKGTTQATAAYNGNVTITAEANDGYEFVKWTDGEGNLFSTNASVPVSVTTDARYIAVFRSTTQQGATELAGKYFRLKVKNTTNYMNIANTSNNTGSTSGVTVVAKNESSDTQIFLFEQSGDSYKLKANSGNYIKCHAWNANANATTAGDATELTFESTGNELEYFIKWDNTNMNQGVERDDYFKAENGYVYCDAASTAATTWVLEEVVYYTVTATAGEGGSVSPLTSTIEKGKPVTLTATANEGYRFVNWTLNGNVVSTDASYTFNATATGEYVANFEISTYTISATANPGTAGSVTINGEAVSSKNVNENSTVTLVATPQAGYYFVNWTNGTDVVSTDATYTFTATADTNLEANFEQIVVDVVLTEIIGTNAGQTNKYRIRLDGFTNGITKETVAAKLVELYPYIALGEKSEDEVIDNGKLQINGNSYTYTNNVILPFKVSNAQNEIWHNIYWPSNTSDSDYPVYLSASDASDTYVSKVTGNYAYGDHPTYNTSNGNDKISWAIYNVNNGFEFIFKNKVTGKYIQVTSVANGDAQNVVYVENATDATVFTIEKKPAENDYDTDAQYSLTANVGEEKGYLCSTSATGYNYATHYNSNGHQGAWFEFVESPYYEVMLNDTYAMYYYYAGVGEGKCIITDALVPIVENLGDFEKWGGLTYNTINAYAAILEEAWRWPAIKLNIKPTEGGTTSINGEENVTKKKAPIGYQLPLVATPAVGYHFVNWSDSTSTVLSENAEYTTSTSGSKNWVTNINVNFAINIYNINITAGEGGNASASATTVEHGSEVTLTAEANDGYKFDGWYNGEVLVSAEANYPFTVTSDINYTARFSEAPTGTVAIHITVASTDGTEVTNTLEGNVKAIIDGIGMEWATDAEFAADANVALSATSDHNQKGYLFDGWYKNGELVNKEKDIVVKATETATYEARFFRGCIVIGYSNNTQFGRVMGITLADGTSIGYDASSRAVVKAGTTVKINTMNIKDGYEVGSWINVNDEIVGTDNSLIVEVNEDVTYTAIFEPVSYELTVRANDDSYGTVTAESGTSSGTTIKVGHNMEATITATANTGYYFVNWTKGTDVVSTEATYTIPGISEYDDMVDVEYIANFLPVENAVAGVYYRIGYDFPVAAAVGAARAAGDVQTLTISYANGSFSDASNDGNRAKIWTSNSNSPTVTLTATSNGIQYRNICKVSNGVSPLNLSLEAHPNNNGEGLDAYDGTTFTIAVDNEDYKITAYSISYNPFSNGYIDGHNNNQLAESGLNVSNVSFTVKGTGTYSAVDIQSFTVTIQQVGGEGSGETPETPSNRYYIQSVTCGVSGGNNLQNALEMTKETGAASIFYYADSKLLSYDKGTYIKEDGGTRGLQEVGASGTVTITTTGETSTIAAPNYMHANSVTSGTNTTYFIDHCSGNPDNHATSHNFVLEEVTTLPVTITAALHATFYAPVAVKIPEGVKAYVLKAENIPGIETYAWMTSLKNGIIPANTGVILKAAEGTYDFDIVGDDVDNYDEARTEAVGNVLSGTVAKTKITHDAYILANREGKIGLYPVAKNSYLDNSTNGTTVRFTNNSHKAYLPVTDDWFGEQLKKGTGFRFVYDDEETTGIDEFEREVEDTIYDLQGRKLSEITEPGIYIVGDKKVWIK